MLMPEPRAVCEMKVLGRARFGGLEYLVLRGEGKSLLISGGRVRFVVLVVCG